MDFKDCIKKKIVKEIKEDLDLMKSLLKTSRNKYDSEKKLDLTNITLGSKISLA